MQVTEVQLLVDGGNGQIVPAQVTEDGGRALLDNGATIARMAKNGVPVRTIIVTEEDEIPLDRCWFPGQAPQSDEDEEALERVSPEQAKEVLEQAGELDEEGKTDDGDEEDEDDGNG